MRRLRLRMVRALNVALMLAAALMCAAVFIDIKLMREGYFFDTPQTSLVDDVQEKAPSPEQAVPVVPQKPQLSDYSDILENGAFAPGAKLSYLDVIKPQESVQQRPMNAAESQFSLLGTIVSIDGDSFAIFEHKFTRKQEVVRQGGIVQGVGQLARIEKDRVAVSSAVGDVTFVMPHLDRGYSRPQSMESQPSAPYNAQPPAYNSGDEGMDEGIIDDASRVPMGMPPGMPGMPGMSGVSGASGASGMSGMPGASGVPGMPGMPGASGVPGVPSPMVRPERMRDAPAVFTPPPPRAPGTPGSPSSISTAGLDELAYFLTDAVTVIDDEALKSRITAGVAEPAFVGFAADSSGAVYSGFIVGDAGEWSLGELLSLRRGDLVIKANAATLDAPEKWVLFMDAVSRERDLEIEVLRDGRVEKFFYEVR